MAEQDATAVAITGGTINNTTIGATTATTGKFTSVTTPSVTATTLDLALNSVSTGSVNFSSAGGQLFKISDGGAYGGYWNAFSASGSPSLRAIGNVSGAIDTNSAVPIQFRTNLGTSGAEQFRVGHTASAVNYVQVTGSATGANPTLSVQGSDAIRGFGFNTKSTGAFLFYSNSGSNLQFRIDGSQAAVNYLQTQGSVATQAVIHSAQGSDTNISMAFQPKGTGAIDLAAGSSGVNISNGGTVTAITRTATGSGYTSIPTIAVSAPTTAGGVQAVVTQASMAVGAVAINNGGTGYTVGNTLTVTGGTGGNCTITVSTVSSGVITGITFATTSPYTVLPTNPVSVTGGSGSSATFNLTYGISSVFTISNAGSGYIEQPTVTFSGGGGSGAAAYATVGGTTIVRSLGNNLTINNPSGTSFAVSDAGATSAQWWQAIGGAFTGILRSTGSTQNGQIQTGGTGSIQFLTNSGAQEQLRVSHTASAVNYVQVTGSATGGLTTISAQGSDANIPLAINSKGASAVRFASQNADYPILNGGTGTVSLGVAGSSANIDLALGAKGTGVVAFGTYTGTISAITGYITIKDSGGTLRRLAVVA
jgi:hypothetical protein